MFHFLFRVMLGSCCAGALLLPLTAEARPADSGNAAASAALVDQGIELRRQGKDAEALNVFKQAVLLQPDSVRALIHVATCYQAVGDWVSADTHLRRALEHTADPYIERHREALENAHRVIADRLGMLEVGGGPAGAIVLLNGQRMGQLPLSEPIRATVGDYLLEVKMPGHYPTSRPVSIKSRTLVREDVQLASAGARSSEAFAAGSASGGAASAGSSHSEGGSNPGAAKSQWLTWTLGGLGGAAAITAVTALIVRNESARHWNDDERCLNVPGRTRQDLCGDERDSAKTAENVALIGGTAAVFLGAGALLSSFITNRTERPETSLGFLGGCTLTPEGASCHGSF